MKLIIFDIEATGLSDSRICQLAYIIHENGEAIGVNRYYAVDEMSEGAQEVHGLSMEMLETLSGGLRFEDDARRVFDEFGGCDMLVGHNVSADVGYLSHELARHGLTLPRKKTFCTMNYFTAPMQLARKLQSGRPKPPRLEELAAYFELTAEEVVACSERLFSGGGAAHDARYDAAATYLCLQRATAKGQLRGVL